MLKQHTARLILTATILANAWIAPSNAFAQTLTVYSSADSGPGTLREAMLAANANLGADIIVFDSSLSGEVIEITSAPLPSSTDDLVVDGSSLNESVTLEGPTQIATWPTVYGLLCESGTMQVKGLNTMGFMHGLGSLGTCEFMHVGDDQIERGLVRADGAQMYGVYLQSSGTVVNTIAGERAPNERGVYVENARGVSVGSVEPFGQVVGANNLFNGINFFNSEEVRLVNAEAYNNGEMGVRFKTSSGILGGESEQEAIYLHENGFYGISIVYSAHDVIVKNANLEANLQAGIYMDGTVQNVTIENSTIAHHNELSANGVAVDFGAQNVNIHNNSFIDNDFAVSIRSSDVSVVDNEIEAVNQGGILIGDMQGNVQNVELIGNIINGANSAIQLNEQNPNNFVSNVLLQNNQILNAHQSGISIQSGNRNLSIWGNTIDSDTNGIEARGDAIDMDASQDATKKNHVIRSQVCMMAKGSDIVFKGNECMGSILAVEGAHDNAFELNEVCPQGDFMPIIMMNAGNGNRFRKNSVTCAFGEENIATVQMIQRPFESMSNAGTPTPENIAINTGAVSGTAHCAQCVIDIYGQMEDRRVDWLGETMSDTQGSFNASPLGLSAYENVIIASTDANNNTSPSSIPVRVHANAIPTMQSVSVEQLRDGSKKASIQVLNLSDADENAVDVWFEYSIDAGQTWHRATLDSPSEGTVGQQGQVAQIQTQSTGGNLTVFWNIQADVGDAEITSVLMHAAAFDGVDWGSMTQSGLFQVDTMAPAQPVLNYPARTRELWPLVSLTGGEPFSRVFTEGKDSGYRVDAFGRSQAHLYLPVLGPKQKVLQLVDAFGNQSRPIKFTVVRY